MLRLRSIAFGICFLLVGGFAASGPASAQWGPEPYDGLAYPDPIPAYPAYGEPTPPSGTSPYTEGSPSAPGDYLVEQNSSLSTRRLVRDPTGQPPGTIVVDTPVRKLYLVLGHGEAIEYGIGVGRQGFEWKGTARVGRKAEWPTWTPPAEMLKRRPDLPTFMEGGIDNPLGARALYLFKGKVDTLFRIHGTNEPDTIGHAVSSGCIRMMNADVIDLYQRVRVGTRVVVL